jgi:hypothetical protein
MATKAYGALPFPLSNLPDPDERVTLVDLRDEALPRLRGAHCTLRGLSLGTAAPDWEIIADLGPTLAVLADDVAKCRDQIDRAPHGELRDAVLPKLRSAHCLLDALSLAIARDIVLVEELAPALNVLAGQLATCRDRVDRATRDV